MDQVLVLRALSLLLDIFQSRLLLLLAFYWYLKMEMKSESKKVFLREGFITFILENYRNWYFSILITTQHKIHESNIKKQVSNFDEILPVAVLWPMILGNRVIMVTSPLGHIIIELLYNTHIRPRYRARQAFLGS